MTRRRYPSHRRAFSLIETVLVISILSVVVAIGLPRYAKSLSRYRVESAAQRLVNDLVTLRQRAVDQSTTATITLESTTHTLQATGVGGLDHSATQYTTDFTASPFEASLVLGTNPTVLTFNGHGRCDQTLTITVQSGSATKQVQITAPTGAISR